MHEYDDAVLNCFLKNQLQLFPVEVAETLEEAENFLEECLAVVVDSVEEVIEYFEDEGIDLTLVNGGGADKVMTAMISGEADIGFMGSEASIYTYAGGEEDYAVNFAQLTQRAGNFLVGRVPEDDFQWSDLKGKKVLGGRAGVVHKSM